MRGVLGFLSFACLGLTSCTSVKKEPPAKAEARQTTLIGTIELVNPEQNYVLIRCEQAFALPAGAELQALDANGGQSKLKLTPERKGLYLTADIQSGDPQVGHLVLYHTEWKAAEEKTEEAPPAEPSTSPESPPPAETAAAEGSMPLEPTPPQPPSEPAAP